MQAADVGPLLGERRTVWLEMRLAGRWLSLACVFAVALITGYASGGADGKATTLRTLVCGRATGVAAWSRDGKRIAYVGRRHAICVASADGTHARPLPYTICGKTCRLHLPDPPIQLDWVRPKLLLYLDYFQLFEVQIGQRPRLLGKVQGGIDTFATDASGDRVALGSSVCSLCRGPVTVLSVPAGRIVGQIGGPTADNYFPSLSPDGKRIVFMETEPRIGVWTALADGSNLEPLRECEGTPLWSPKGDTILCSGLSARPPHHCCSLSLVSPQGGASRTLVPGGVAPNLLLAWSPNGRRVVFRTGRCGCRLAGVNVRTRKTRVLGGNGNPVSADWSPDSRQLLVSEPSPVSSTCALLWRVPADGTKPQRIRNCS